MTSYDLKRLWKKVRQINQYKDAMRKLSDGQLKDKTKYFREKIANGTKLDDLLPEVFATVREVDYRVLGLFPYDVQALGAIVLHEGNVAEMKTGEGKTLTATMPLYLNALTGKSTMLVTSNEYLANRDAAEMGAVFEWLGLSCKCSAINDPDVDLSAAEKKQIYQADIVYTTSGTLGFDYLIDNLAGRDEEKFMPEFNYAIVDEVDQVLLDNAQTPLIISGAPRVQSNMYRLANDFVRTLEEDIDFEYDDEEKSVKFTNTGIKVAEAYFRIDNLFDGNYLELLRHITLALRARMLFENGKDYVVDDDQVKLLDEQNGRIMEMTKLQAGQHQAIEAAENVEITANMRAMASITFQNLFRMFKRLAGMTGTGKTANEEFIETYYMKVIQIPTNKRVIRKDLPDKIYTTLSEKLYASLTKVRELHQKRQPILIVTGSVELSEIYSEMLLREGIAHNVLNARNVAKEAAIIAEAGQLDSVTVATSMAGRGTDIKLGQGVAQLGGLAVIGTEKMMNRRVELQLRGRAGRQGDPGFSQFYVCLEDEVIIKNGVRWLKKYFEHHRNRDFTNPRLIKSLRFKHAINRSQKSSDSNGVKQRKNSLEFDESLRVQREKIYAQRNELIYKTRKVEAIVETLLKKYIDYSLNKLALNESRVVLRFILDNIDYHFEDEKRLQEVISNRDDLKKYLLELIKQKLTKKVKELNQAEIEDFYRTALLKAIDSSWIEEVDSLQQLRTAVASRSAGQKNPIFEYHQEAGKSYLKMQLNILTEIVHNLLLSRIGRNKDGETVLYFL
ncbi:accessory Sec system translocase SecA2 [Liquorilactobacillus hordei]|uniref:accessory Sec system translocase SecA2 n=1 Tax=Liquorilactobacillus hordei TaxID=468911 RepID=UPI001CBAF701|nr:accessory Sec system translocase SecA2 [Liquorilactobacillus hordei]MBZ2405246.1 accessory Sec system translocase SecA2 [Liquorilactobacillus hordei]